MTQTEWDNCQKIMRIWRYLGDQMFKYWGKPEFLWYADAAEFYNPICETAAEKLKI